MTTDAPVALRFRENPLAEYFFLAIDQNVGAKTLGQFQTPGLDVRQDHLARSTDLGQVGVHASDGARAKNRDRVLRAHV